jgi:hypothetical protein
MTPAALGSQPGVSTCPSCGRPIRRPRHTPVPAEASASVDTREMSDADLYRHHHRTAPVEDLRFFLQYARMSADLRASGEALLTVGCRETGGALSRSEWYRRLTALQDRWRQQPTDGAVPTVSLVGQEVA